MTEVSPDWVRVRAAYPLGDIYPSDYRARRRDVEANHRKELIAAAPTVVSLRRWDGDVSARRIRVRAGELSIECFGTPSETRRLYVFLSAGGGPLKDGEHPQFPRVSWHHWLDGVCLNIDDPTYSAFPGKLQTGWYLGTRRSDGVSAVASVISKVQQRYGIEGEDVYIVGSSAGGTAALKIAAAVPAATAIAENPPIHPHLQSTVKHFKKLGINLDQGVFRERNSLLHIFDHPSSRFFILQNWEDTEVVEQLRSLLNEASLPSPRIGLNQFGSLHLYCTSVAALSPHHAFLSVDEFRSLLFAVNRSVPAFTRAAVLDAVHEGFRSRILAADKISNLKGWARLFAALDIPALNDPPLPAEGNAVRIGLRGNASVQYRLRLSHQAKNLFIAVDVKPEMSVASSPAFSQALQAAQARMTEGPGGRTLYVPRVPLADVTDAARRLKAFVDATAPLFS